MTTNELKDAALSVLQPTLGRGPSSLSFELALHDGNELALNRQRDLIAEYRTRVAQMDDSHIRAAYNYWLDFYQRENDEAREEFTTGIKRKAWLQRAEQVRHEREASQRNFEAIPKPPTL